MAHQYRRSIEHCCYCDAAADSNEHVVPCAVGGRLSAPILCRRHNSEASAADKALSTWFAPFTNMLSIPRQDGKIGTSFDATSIDGRDVRVTADGRVEEPNAINERDAHGRILRAVGDLKWLDRLRRQSSGAFATPMPTIALPGIPPIVDIKLGLTDEAWPGIIKIALHFVIGFVGDVSIDKDIRSIVLQNQPPAIGEYLRSVPWDPTLFGAEWPPRHEITAYPCATDTFVTVLLFGVFALVVKLPGITNTAPKRYTQTLDGAPPKVTVVPTAPCRWDPPMAEDEVEEFFEGPQRRMNRIYELCKLRENEDMCIAAARNAIKSTKTMPIKFIDAFEAELQMYAWPAARIDDLVEQTKNMLAKSICPWELPFTRDRGAGWEEQAFLASEAS